MQTREHLLLPPSLGTQRRVTSFHFGDAGAGRKVYIQASLHADELPGMLVAFKLKASLAELEAAGRLNAEVVLVPAANPIGLDQRVLGQALGRFELASGQNFNRHYPALADRVFDALKNSLGSDTSANVAAIRAELGQSLAELAPTSELQSLRLALMRLAHDADLVLDLHCDFNAGAHLYTLTPQWPEVEPLARYLGSCAQLLAVDSGDHPFDEACSQLWLLLDQKGREHAAATGGAAPAIPLATTAITVELRGQDRVEHDLAERDADALIAYLTERGFVAGAAPTPPDLPYPATPLAGVEDLIAPHAGVIAFHRPAGFTVEAGDLVADVIDPISGAVSPLYARHAGMLFARVRDHYAAPGMWVAKIATDLAFKTGKLLSA
ncbi:succinylglutamate desuccinylase/aspartoacylase family protein [Crenobacter cavernae]|uniref:Succinylglutamate desuccinylase n=1 Tax=Crenobacter cavernae TaxID=2290923 RepID=A0A345Y9Z9_9NEIS|nr:succinylglutamate desuccinylase/aspartoacylase family protein [Crenobacter cavernae]AXK40751.1 succinylglutamate desuccinylase [Crenobacter cavernae]